MKKGSLKKSVFLFLLISILPAVNFLYAQSMIVNPAKGLWANKQMLVLDTSRGGEYYYSIDGSNPVDFGFFYDRPVLLDVEGDVNLTVSHVSPEGKTESESLRFSVNPDRASDKPYADFISQFFDFGLINYTSGTDFSIPTELSFKINNSEEFMRGMTLSISEKNVLFRYVPCVVRPAEGGKNWRFVIRTYPHVAGLNNQRKVPLQIENWDTLIFTDPDLLYKVDDEYWTRPKDKRILDRSVEHVISWQDIDYFKGQPVDFCILPARPEIQTLMESDGTTSFIVKGDSSYTMSVKGENGRYTDLYNQIGADVFYGDNAAGTLKIGLFSNSVYQGEIDVPYSIDKRAPPSPKITSDFDGFYSRRNVNINIETQPVNELYVAVSRPILIKDVRALNDEVIRALKETSVGNFRKMDSSSFKYSFKKNDAGALFYKIQTYSKNAVSQSPFVEYSLIIDSFNYFYDSEANDPKPDGSAAHPYSSVRECIEDINNCTSVKLYARGNIEFPPEEIRLKADCEIINQNNAFITFNPGACLSVDSSALSLSDIRIQRENKKSEGSEEGLLPLFKIENGTLEVKNCELAAAFSRNGSIIDVNSGVVKIYDSIASVNAFSYASFISSVDSYVIIKDSNVNTSAETSVIISAGGGNVDAINNQLKVSARTGRIAELFSVKADFEKNVYKCELPFKPQDFVMVYANKDSVLTQLENEDYVE